MLSSARAAYRWLSSSLHVPDSEEPLDSWVSIFAPENFFTYSAAEFATAQERYVR
jgi:hypothetical protein